MDIHERNLVFLKAVVSHSETEAVFLAEKRDLRLALFELLKAEGTSLASLLSAYSHAIDPEEKLQLLKQIQTHFCPNPAFLEILRRIKQRKTPKLAQQTMDRLNAFRRPPNKAMVNQLFDGLGLADEAVAVFLLDLLRPFGREIAHKLDDVLLMGSSENMDLSKAALMLLPHIPEGFDKGFMLFWKQVQAPALRFRALNALQSARGLNPDLLYKMFEPILRDYERRIPTEGEMNELWMEVNMIRSILSNNGGANRVWLLGNNTGFKKR